MTSSCQGQFCPDQVSSLSLLSLLVPACASCEASWRCFRRLSPWILPTGTATARVGWELSKSDSSPSVCVFCPTPVPNNQSVPCFAGRIHLHTIPHPFAHKRQLRSFQQRITSRPTAVRNFDDGDDDDDKRRTQEHRSAHPECAIVGRHHSLTPRACPGRLAHRLSRPFRPFFATRLRTI
ncbi:hypothetical protein B0J18DRAFT_58980 [Chaetomium sp. MPI-SDFR-AT-0129]|nr:hypothetical protein B0J18DRAFT_58980 [Chaetomium sp. MPI-SDFR-AT-0129]